MEEPGWQGKKQCLPMVRYKRNKGQDLVSVPLCSNWVGEKKVDDEFYSM